MLPTLMLRAADPIHQHITGPISPDFTFLMLNEETKIIIVTLLERRSQGSNIRPPKCKTATLDTTCITHSDKNTLVNRDSVRKLFNKKLPEKLPLSGKCILKCELYP